MKTRNRFYFIDYIRTFVVFLVVLDHVAQAYGLRSGDSWFVKDPARADIYDCLHLIVDTFHMAILFLLAGMFVIPSASRRGIANFLKERWLKLGIPFIMGVILLVPPQTYYKYLQSHDYISYWAYLTDHVFKVDWYASSIFEFDYPLLTGDLASSAFWFLYFLMLLTLVALFVWKCMPFVIQGLRHFCDWMIRHPLKGYFTVSLISVGLIIIAEFFWGARFSASFWKLFWVRGNLFMLYCLYFSLGIGMQAAGYLDENREWLRKLSNSWFLWMAFTLILAATYVWYCLAFYDEGAFSYDILIHFHRGGTWENVWPVMADAGPLTWIRALLHGFLYNAITITLIAVFYRFLNHENTFWLSLTAASFGIYIFHEPICVGVVYYLTDSSLPIFIKFLTASVGVYAFCWLMLDKALLKAPFIKRIIG